ncbi:MAG: hypothetical protein Fur0020_10350 [Thermodesulfovibrionia bacterium]
MDFLSITLKTVTPLFLCGANPHDSPELRAPSIKGMMRFWYRAIDPDYRQWEDKIFGSTDHGEGSFLIKVIPQFIKKGKKDDNFPKGITYLGYGPILRNKATKDYMRPDTVFTVEFRLKETEGRDIIIKKIEKSLWALCVLGGLGSRSRRGFGSLRVENITGSSFEYPWQFNNFESFKECLEGFCASLPKRQNLPTHTCFSEKTRCVVVYQKNDALQWLGNELLNYRSFYGDNPPNFKKDKEDVFDYLDKGNAPTAPPLRTVFGLPHNYFFTKSFNHLKGRAPRSLFKKNTIKKLLNNGLVKVSDDGKFIFFVNGFKNRLNNIISDESEIKNILNIWQQSLKGTVELNLMEDNQKGRRASPIIFHIQKFKDNTECVVATFFPSKFIPDDKCITISNNFNMSKEISPLSINFKAIDDFMTRLEKAGGHRIL